MGIHGIHGNGIVHGNGTVHGNGIVNGIIQGNWYKKIKGKEA